VKGQESTSRIQKIEMFKARSATAKKAQAETMARSRERQSWELKHKERGERAQLECKPKAKS